MGKFAYTSDRVGGKISRSSGRCNRDFWLYSGPLIFSCPPSIAVWPSNSSNYYSSCSRKNIGMRGSLDRMENSKGGGGGIHFDNRPACIEWFHSATEKLINNVAGSSFSPATCKWISRVSGANNTVYKIATEGRSRICSKRFFELEISQLYFLWWNTEVQHVQRKQRFYCLQSILRKQKKLARVNLLVRILFEELRVKCLKWKNAISRYPAISEFFKFSTSCIHSLYFPVRCTL